MAGGDTARVVRRIGTATAFGVALAAGTVWIAAPIASRAEDGATKKNGIPPAAKSNDGKQAKAKEPQKGKPPESSEGPGGPDGKAIFRHDTYGDERFWTDTLRMHEVIQTLDPLTALSLGMKVDADALPPEALVAIASGAVDLKDPQTTLLLIELDAVVGVKGTVQTNAGKRTLTRVGITCALCHSTVDDSFVPGIGRRLDGWANLDLDPGAIIAASPAVPDEKKAVYLSWGPGRYDPRFNIDGLNTPVVIPPAFGLAA